MNPSRRTSLAGLGLLAAGRAASRPAAPADDALEPNPWAAVAVTGRTWRVGPGADVRTIREAAHLALDGDTVEILTGDYASDVAVWLQRRLTLRAIGGPVRLHADGASAEDKAIWVIRDGEFDISGIEFTGARVLHRNGAGIRFERGRLVLRRCRFIDNEMGVLTGNDPQTRFAVESCEFVGPAPGESLSHNLYVGTIARFDMVASRSSHARHGHLVKSRAAVARLSGNLLADGAGGYASYELDLPNGGVAVLTGNVFVQEPGTENDVIVAYGAEGYRWPRNELVMSHNTLVNRRADGVFVRVFSGPGNVTARNNLWIGNGRFDGFAPRSQDGNASLEFSDCVDAEHGDFRLARGSRLKGKAQPSGTHAGRSLRPAVQYVDPMSFAAVAVEGPLDPGALQSAP